MSTRKLFDIEDWANEISKVCSDMTGKKLGWIINQSIYSYLLPKYLETLIIESNYILQTKKDDLTQKDFQTCLARAIKCIKKYKLKSPEIFQRICGHFQYDVFEKLDYQDITKKIRDEAFSKLSENATNTVYDNASLIFMGEQIIDNWTDVWQEDIMYDLFYDLIYVSIPKRDFTWYETINIMKEMENEIIRDKLK